MNTTKPFLLFLITFAAWCNVTAQVITTVAGNGIPGFSGDGGTATSAQFNNPISVALDAAGNLYVSDFANHRLRKINTATGIITTIAGTGMAGFSGDGGPAANAQMNNPGDLCLDGAGNIYFIDNQNFRIRKIDAATNVITTVAGNGTANYAGGSIPAVNAGIHYPNGLAIDATNLYISLFSKQIICKVNLSTGILSTIAGNGTNGFAGDGGPAVNASFGYPAGLSVNTSGEIFVADYNNNRIRKIDAAGIITTIAGNGIAAYSGDGGPATSASLNLPTGVATDASGNIFIADRNNYRIRKVTVSTGIITTVAGSGTFGYGGDGGLATSPCAKLADPHKVRVDAAGNLFISDQSNSRIRKVDINPVNAVTPVINISTSSIAACAGANITFNSSISNGGINPVYQWKLNGSNTGTNNPVFSTSSLNNGDLITCELTASSGCGIVTVVSNTISVNISPGVIPGITIAASATTICAGNNITFTATPSNEGTSPSYQWKINGTIAGTNSSSFVSNTLSNGDIVSCTMLSNAICAMPASVSSNNITIIVNPVVTPAVNITASSTSICSGGNVVFNAVTTNSGNNPSYQWQINGVNAGTNSSAFSSSSLQNGDLVSCNIIADPVFTCATVNSASSQQIAITVSASPAPFVTIVASDNNICSGIPITFTATPQHAGSVPSYQWKLNDNNVGTNDSVYQNNNPANGDKVVCVLTSPNASCSSSPVSSNSIIIMLKNIPGISISPLNAIVQAGGQVQLTATVTGPLASFQWSPAAMLTNPLSLTSLTLPLNATTTFTLSVTNTDGCTNTKEVTVKVYKPLLMPSAFTPNGDGLNDVYRIPPDVLLTLNNFSVYNRWGNMVFTTSDIAKGWNGKVSGVSADTGIFLYTISGTSEGKKVFLKGTFVLIR